jgi:hypothetical protein
VPRKPTRKGTGRVPPSAPARPALPPLQCEGVDFDRLHRIIAARGHAVQGVLGTATQPTWSYTIGLWPKYGYELIVFMIDPRIATAILNSIADSLAEGVVIPLDTKLPDEPGGINKWISKYPALFKQCLPERLGPPHEYVNMATQVHGKLVPFRQLVLCDKVGLFPGEPAYGAAQPVIRHQPLLYEALP